MSRPYSIDDPEDMKTDQVLFTKEELAENVKVPPMVEQDLKRIISDRMEQCGLYFRCFQESRPRLPWRVSSSGRIIIKAISFRI